MCFTCNQLVADILVDFDELNTFSPGSGGTYYNGNSGNGTNTDGWSSQGVNFGNSYNSSFGGFWNGFSYSNVNNTTTPGFTNQYAAITGAGIGGSGNYAVAFAGSNAYFDLPTSHILDSIYITNTTYAFLSMRDGDAFAKQFGGDSGDDPDFFSITFTGFSGLQGTGSQTGQATFDLADYRFDDNSLDYIVDEWTQFGLTDLNNARSVSLSFDSSDVGNFGINTPLYVALDNLALTAVPEPGSLSLVSTIALLGLIRRRNRRSENV